MGLLPVKYLKIISPDFCLTFSLANGILFHHLHFYLVEFIDLFFKS